MPKQKDSQDTGHKPSTLTETRDERQKQNLKEQGQTANIEQNKDYRHNS